MSQFLIPQLDYIFFFYGLAFILLMAVCFIIYRVDEKSCLRWKLLGMFGLIHGLNEWLDMLAISLGDSTGFSNFRTTMMLVSFVALTEFGRRGLRCRQGKSPGPWIYLPIAAVIIVIGTNGSRELNVVIRYTLGFLGGLMAAWALWRAAQIERSHHALKNAAIIMAMYAVAAGAVVPEASFFPASVVNYTWFITYTSIPIQMLRGVLAIVFTSIVWSFHQTILSQLRLENKELTRAYTGRQLTTLICLLLIAGGIGTHYWGLEALREAQRDILRLTKTVTGALNGERIKALYGNPIEKKNPNYMRLRQQLVNLNEVNPDFSQLRLMTQKDGQIIVLVDSVDEKAINHKEPGTPYKHPPTELFNVFSSGAAHTTEPYWDEDGTFVSGYAAITDPDNGKPIAVVGVDVSAATWQHKLALNRLFAIAITLSFISLIIGFFIIRQKMLESEILLAASQKRLDEARLQKQQELEELNRSLEKIVAQRTAKLTESNRELQHFAYIASHDLQEPLRTITSFVQLLAKRYQGKLDQDADEFMGFITDGALRMKVLINDLLAYSRVESKGKNFADFDGEKTLEQTIASLHLAISESGAQVTHDPLPILHGDEVQISQLLQNLIGNAIKFRGSEPPRIHIGCIEQPEAWQISVRDNGIGIEPRFFDRIFDIFQRLHSREQYAGTGIGLAVCKKIVDRHGGRITVESEPGQGSTFAFSISKVPQEG